MGRGPWRAALGPGKPVCSWAGGRCHGPQEAQPAREAGLNHPVNVTVRTAYCLGLSLLLCGALLRPPSGQHPSLGVTARHQVPS